MLGNDYYCIPAGLNGRTTAFDDSDDDSDKELRNGLKSIDLEFQTHKPLDLVVVMLETNDSKYTDALGSASGMEKLIEAIITVNERFSYTSPFFPI